MKKLLLLATIFLPTLLFAQITPDPFTITGTFTKLTPTTRAYLFYQQGANKVVDSAEITEGKFVFNGMIINPEVAYLVIDHTGRGVAGLGRTPDVLNFFLEKGIYYINGKDSSYSARVTGSKLNDENYELQGQLKPLEAPTAQLMASVNSATPQQQNDPAFRKDMNARAKVIQDQQMVILKSFIRYHTDSFVSISVINQMGPHVNDPSELEGLFNSLSQPLKDSEPGRSLKYSIDKTKLTGIGVVAPDFTQNDVNGNPVTLSSLRGKYVLIDFWASWCGPCRQENPNLVKTYNKYKTKNFTVLGVSLDRPDGKADWLRAIKTDGLTWTQVSDLNFWSNHAAVAYFINEIPSNFLLDPNGKIVARNLRGEDLEAKLAEIFGAM